MEKLTATAIFPQPVSNFLTGRLIFDLAQPTFQFVPTVVDSVFPRGVDPGIIYPFHDVVHGWSPTAANHTWGGNHVSVVVVAFDEGRSVWDPGTIAIPNGQMATPQWLMEWRNWALSMFDDLRGNHTLESLFGNTSKVRLSHPFNRRTERKLPTSSLLNRCLSHFHLRQITVAVMSNMPFKSRLRMVIWSLAFGRRSKEYRLSFRHCIGMMASYYGPEYSSDDSGDGPNDLPFICPVCNRSYSNNSGAFTRHIREEHPNVDLTTNHPHLISLTRCAQCDRIFKKRPNGRPCSHKCTPAAVGTRDIPDTPVHTDDDDDDDNVDEHVGVQVDDGSVPKFPPLRSVKKEVRELFTECTLKSIGLILAANDTHNAALESAASQGFLSLPALLLDAHGKPDKVAEARRRLQRFKQLSEADVPAALAYVTHTEKTLWEAFQRIPTVARDPTESSSRRKRARITRVQRLLGAHQVSEACRLYQRLDDDNFVSADAMDTYREDLLRLHPRATQIGALPRENHANTEAELAMLRPSDTQVRLTAKKLAPLKAEGCSSWTSDLITEVMAVGGQPLTEHVTKLFHLMLLGKIADSTPWTRSRLVALRKADGKPRPIAIGDAWGRFLGKCVALKWTKNVANTKLHKIQFGVGISGGIEKMAHQVRLAVRYAERAARTPELFGADYLDNPTVVIAVDMSNAFNSIQRGAIFDALQGTAPGLQPLFRWQYGTPSPLHLSNGHFFCNSESGVRQGDPLGPLYFSIGLHPVLLEVQDDFPDVQILAYLDDIVICGPRTEALAALASLRLKVARKLGLEVNMSKTVMYDPTVVENVVQADGLKVVRDGFVLLGSPMGFDDRGVGVGTENFTNAYAEQQLIQQRQVLVGMQDNLGPRSTFVLLKQCVNMRPTFLMRMTLPDLVMRAAIDFDDEVDRTLAGIMGWQGVLPAKSQILRGLPQHLAGLGVRRLADLQTVAFASSFVESWASIAESQVWEWVASHSVALLDDYTRALSNAVPGFIALDEQGLRVHQVPDPDEGPESVRRRTRLATDRVHVDEEPDEIVWRDLLRGASDEAQKLQRRLMAQVDRANFTTVYNAEQSPQWKAWLLGGKARNTGDWMKSVVGGTAGYTSMDPATFETAMRLRVRLQDVGTDPTVNGMRCLRCDSPLEVDEAMFHAWDCAKLGLKRTRRHTKLRRVLANFLLKLFPQNCVYQEKPVGPERGGLGRCKADIRLQAGGETFWVDLVVVTGCAVSHRRQGSSTRPGAECEAAEAEKRRFWVSQCGQEANEKLVPFAVNTAGRLGREAKEFLNKVSDDNIRGRKPGVDAKLERRRFLKIFSSEVQKWNVELIELARRRFEERVGVVREDHLEDEVSEEEVGVLFNFQPTSTNFEASQRTDGDDRNVTPSDERGVIGESPGTASTSAHFAVRRTGERVLRPRTRTLE